MIRCIPFYLSLTHTHMSDAQYLFRLFKIEVNLLLIPVPRRERAEELPIIINETKRYYARFYPDQWVVLESLINQHWDLEA